MASLHLDMAMLRFRLALRYAADQPRVPAGSGRESGRWTSGGGVRVAQNGGPGRFTRQPLPQLRIGGRVPVFTLQEEIELEFAQVGRDNAVANARARDPNFRLPGGVYSSVRGYIDQLRDETDAADLHVIYLDRASAGLPPLNRRELNAPGSPSLRTTPTEDLVMLGGAPIGYRHRSAGDNIQTVDLVTF